MNRAERRRRARAKDRKDAALIVGDGIVATGLGHKYEAIAHAELAPKVRGEHRFVVTAAWVAPRGLVNSAFDADVIKLLDQENLMALSIGCVDCEQPLGTIEEGSYCPSSASEDW